MIKSSTLESIDELCQMLDIHPLRLLALTYQYAEPDISLGKLFNTIQTDIKKIMT